VNRFSESLHEPVTTDLHQHLWPTPFLDALRARRSGPRLVGWELRLPGERSYAVDPVAHDAELRAELAAADGLELACVAPSASLGLDRLPPDEAAELAAAWLEGALALPPPFRPWALAAIQEPDPYALRDALARGAVGLEVAADVLAAPDGLARLAPLLDVLAAAGAPLLVHPGPAGPADAVSRPSWWGPVVPYVAQLHAAWWAWADGGRERFPALPVCFVALAGLGPLHGERQRARGGSARPVDPLTFVETSSYGTQAVDAVVRVLGIDVVCHGSDRPYARPPAPDLGAAALHAIRTANPGRLLARRLEEVPA
jgi:6-methylsalicylate decarboxylase